MAVSGTRQRGVTLVELLVVLAMIAMLAGVVVLNAPPVAGEAQREAERFAARIDLAAQTAITSGAVLGVELRNDGYRFLQFQRGAWAQASADDFKAGAFSADVAVAFSFYEPAKSNEPEDVRDDEEVALAPDVVFSPTGETTPVVVSFATPRAAVAVTLNNVGVVRVGDDNERE